MKNTIFIILFLVVCAAAFAAGSYRPDSLPVDRSERGRFTQSGGSCRYDSEKYGVRLTFDSSWVVYDGMQLEKRTHSYHNMRDIENIYGCPLNDIAFLCGFVAPKASAEIVSIRNAQIPDESFDDANMDSLIGEMQESVKNMGGRWNGGKACTIPAKGGGTILVCYYDYDFLGKFYSVFSAKMNSNGSSITIDGNYSDADGLQTLLDFTKKTELPDVGTAVEAQT